LVAFFKRKGKGGSDFSLILGGSKNVSLTGKKARIKGDSDDGKGDRKPEGRKEVFRMPTQLKKRTKREKRKKSSRYLT